MVTCTGHIGIHEGADGRTDVRTDVDDVMAIKPNFLTSMGYHIFLTMVLRYQVTFQNKENRQVSRRESVSYFYDKHRFAVFISCKRSHYGSEVPIFFQK